MAERPAPMPVQDPVSPDVPKLSMEEIQRAKEEARQSKERRAAEKAPTTKTTMGQKLRKGGYVKSADGIAKRGKTRCKVV